MPNPPYRLARIRPLLLVAALSLVALIGAGKSSGSLAFEPAIDANEHHSHHDLANSFAVYPLRVASIPDYEVYLSGSLADAVGLLENLGEADLIRAMTGEPPLHYEVIVFASIPEEAAFWRANDEADAIRYSAFLPAIRVIDERQETL